MFYTRLFALLLAICAILSAQFPAGAGPSASTGGTSTPPGTNGQLPYNNSGSYGATTMLWDSVTQTLTVPGGFVGGTTFQISGYTSPQPTTPGALQMTCWFHTDNTMKCINSAGTITTVGTGTSTGYPIMRTIPCQAGSAAAPFSFPTGDNAHPVPVCVSGLTNAVDGVLPFNENYSQSFQDKFVLNGTTVSADVWWTTSLTTGVLALQFYTSCQATGEAGDPAWNPVQVVTSTANASSGVWTKATASLTMTGCSSGEIMRVKVLRDPAHVNDTLNASLTNASPEWPKIAMVMWTVQ